MNQCEPFKIQEQKKFSVSILFEKIRESKFGHFKIVQQRASNCYPITVTPTFGKPQKITKQVRIKQIIHNQSIEA